MMDRLLIDDYLIEHLLEKFVHEPRTEPDHIGVVIPEHSNASLPCPLGFFGTALG
jgi:hypothetical protein